MATIPDITIGLVIDNSVSPAVLRLTDNTPGITDADNRIGYVRITQPDGISITYGSFAAPIIAWDGSQVSGTAPIRQDVHGQVQRGEWTVVYYVRKAGFDDTTFTKTFTVAYERPTVWLISSTNYYTGSFKIRDATDWPVTQTITREWNGIARGVGILEEADGSEYYLDIDGKYYDTPYDVLLKATIQTSIELGIAVYDAVTQGITAYPVTSYRKVMDALNALYDASKSGMGCGCEDKCDYLYALGVYQHLRLRMDRCEGGDNINAMWEHLQRLLGITLTWTKAEINIKEWLEGPCGCGGDEEDDGENPPITGGFTAWWGWQETDDQLANEAAILFGQGSALTKGGGTVTADYTANEDPKYLWMAEPEFQPVKTKWYADGFNNSDIGTGETFAVKGIVPGTLFNWRVYMTAFQTQQNENLIEFRIS